MKLNLCVLCAMEIHDIILECPYCGTENRAGVFKMYATRTLWLLHKLRIIRHA